MKCLYVILISTLLVYSCTPKEEPYFPDIRIPETPVNMEDINSEYDDYNSNIPWAGFTSPLCFSSNRDSKGKDFNIIYKLLDVYWSFTKGQLIVQENTRTTSDVWSNNANIYGALQLINSPSEELGPYLIPKGMIYHVPVYHGRYQSYIFLYSSNSEGNQDIKFIENFSSTTYSDPQPVAFLNSPQDDAYPCLTKDTSTVYFCSNREGDFDIYKVPLNTQMDLITNFGSNITATVQKETILSSMGEDKCPYILNDLMVFTSNRAGGYGGYDLYYSVFADGHWSEPANLGDKINTPYDEYRPMMMPFSGDPFSDFMIFSSNRPGGKGGFDLYYVAIKRNRGY